MITRIGVWRPSDECDYRPGPSRLYIASILTIRLFKMTWLSETTKRYLHWWTFPSLLYCTMVISFSLTSSNMVLKVCMAECSASICSSMCKDLSRISSMESVLMSEWCLVRSLCSFCIWSFSFWISVCRTWFRKEVYVYVQLANTVHKKIEKLSLLFIILIFC